jgi:hypothetical protein
MECIPIKKIAKPCHEVYQSVLESGAFHIQCTVDNKITYNNFKPHGDTGLDILSGSTIGAVMSYPLVSRLSLSRSRCVRSRSLLCGKVGDRGPRRYGFTSKFFTIFKQITEKEKWH